MGRLLNRVCRKLCKRGAFHFSSMEKYWKCVDVVVPGPDAESLAYEVAEAFGVGVEITAEGFRFYAEADLPGPDWEERLQPLLEDFRKLNPGTDRGIQVHTQELIEEDWADRWKVHFKPLRVGSHFVICPTWETFDPEAQDRVIWMDPGRAFGTGHHETTRLCLEWLEDWSHAHPVQTSSLLDLGTGSGILAMAGAMLGFGRIVGVDNDGEALEVARENLTVNGLSERIRLMVGSLADFEDVFDVVVANIQAGPLVAMAQPLATRLQPGGMLVLSGILIEQEEHVQSAFQATGLRPVERRADGEWCLLAFQR
jgi:ribosomal protein L11 methyltransferase